MPQSPGTVDECPACLRPRPPVQQHPCWPGGKVAEPPGGVQQGLIPRGGTIQRKSAGTSTTSSSFCEIFCGEGHRQDLVPDYESSWTTTLPVVPHGAHWSHLPASSVLACICSAQAWHLNLIGFACARANLFSLYLVYQGPVLLLQQVSVPATYTTTEQILHRWGQVHRHPVSMRQW